MGKGKRLLVVELAGLPPTVNHMYRTARGTARYKTEAARNWQKMTTLIVRYAYRADTPLAHGEPYTGLVCVSITFRTPDNRRWDLDNRLKALLDCLTMGGVIRDDSQIRLLRVRRVAGSPGQSRTELTVSRG